MDEIIKLNFTNIFWQKAFIFPSNFEQTKGCFFLFERLNVNCLLIGEQFKLVIKFTAKGSFKLVFNYLKFWKAFSNNSFLNNRKFISNLSCTFNSRNWRLCHSISPHNVLQNIFEIFFFNTFKKKLHNIFKVVSFFQNIFIIQTHLPDF